MKAALKARMKVDKKVDLLGKWKAVVMAAKLVVWKELQLAV